MRKYIYYLTTIAIIMCFGACSNEVLFNESDKGFSSSNQGTITLIATMPDDNPTTRVALTQDDDLAISLKWEVNDQLQLVFVQGDTKEKQTVTVKNIFPDGKNAQFDINVPAGISGKFDLYGVYGGGGLSDDNPTLAKLPLNAGDAGLLGSVQERKDVMLHFASKGIEKTDSQVSVDFKHLGSLFGIIVKNTSGATLTGLKEMRLAGGGEGANWAYNSGVGGKTFNLETGEFQETESGGNYISFNAEGMNLADGETLTLWSWSPMLGETWPELSLQAITPDNNVSTTSINTKPVKATAFTTGMVYYYNIEWGATGLKFISAPKTMTSVGVKVHSGTAAANNDYFTREKILMQRNPAGDIIFYELDGTGQFAQTNKIDGVAPWTTYKEFFYVAPKYFIGLTYPTSNPKSEISSYQIVDGAFETMKNPIGGGFGYSRFVTTQQILIGYLSNNKFYRWKLTENGVYWVAPNGAVVLENAPVYYDFFVFDFKAFLAIDNDGILWKRDMTADGYIDATATEMGSNWKKYKKIIPFEDQILGVDNNGDIWLHDLNLEDYWILE